MSTECALQQSQESAVRDGTGSGPAARQSAGNHAQQLAARGWWSPLVITVAGLAAVQTITGVWIYLVPFSSVTQFQVLVHTAAGLLFVLPFGWYVVRHVLVWYAQKVTAVMILGYLAAGLVAVCVISGVWLT